jgi:hypothetical protein
VQRVRRVVGVAKLERAVQRLRRRVERRLDVVVGVVLPVLGAGLAGAGAELVAWRQVERGEERRVTDPGAVVPDVLVEREGRRGRRATIGKRSQELLVMVAVSPVVWMGNIKDGAAVTAAPSFFTRRAAGSAARGMASTVG